MHLLRDAERLCFLRNTTCVSSCASSPCSRMKFTPLVLNCKKALLSAVLGVLAVSSSHAVKYGDEAFGDDEYGKFWAFHSTGVSIVNPDTCQVETTVSVDGDGQPLPSRYYDVIYLEKDGKGYVGINSAIPVDDDAHGLSSGAGEAIFFSSSMEDRQQPVVSRVVVGPRPVHSYGVKIGEEVEVCCNR